MIVLYSIAVLGALGIILGFGLALASKKFAVSENPKIREIEEILPGINCGACGYAGCNAYADAIAVGKAELDLCKPGGEGVAHKIGEIMGHDVKLKEPMVAQRFCNGGKNEARQKFVYDGIETCKAASILNNGFKECSYSCLGLGDCSKVCPVNAITIDENKLPKIDKERCVGCAKCIKECPRNILKLVPKKTRVYMRCSSHYPAKTLTMICKVGCIACRQCEKVCPLNAIYMTDNLAVIDYSKCKSCGKCVSVCPRKSICLADSFTALSRASYNNL